MSKPLLEAALTDLGSMSKLEKDASYPSLEIVTKLDTVLEVEPAELLRKIEIGSTKHAPRSIKLAPRRPIERGV